MKTFIKMLAKKIMPLDLLHSPPSFSLKSDISHFKNMHYGETCVVIGNGPSLNSVDFEILQKFTTFGVNGIFYKTDEVGFIPDYYVVEDGAVMVDNVDRITKYRGKKASFFPTIYKKHFDDRKDRFFFKMDRRFYEQSSYGFEVPQFSRDCNQRIFCNQSVTFINFQLALYMGFQKILLVGMNHDYEIPKEHIVKGHKILSTTDDPNHFHPDYFGAGKTWHDPKLHNVENSYQFFNIAASISGATIVNCTDGGKLEVFSRGKLSDFL